MSEGGSRSYLAIAASIVIAGVLISASLFVAVDGGTRITTTTSTFTTTPTSSASDSDNSIDCSNPTGPGSFATPANTGLPLVVGNNQYRCERVLVLPPGSTGTLVVSYETDLNAVIPPSAGGSDIANFTASVLSPVYSRALAIPEQVLGYTNATGVTITPSIASTNVTALGNATSFTVTYTIEAGTGGSGFFELQYLDACPTMIPLAVGYTASQLNASSFPDYQPFLQGCTQLSMLPGGILTSVSGIQMAWMIETIEAIQTQGTFLSVSSTISPNPGGSTTSASGNVSTPCPSDGTCGSFTYAAGNQVEVNSVQATEFVCDDCGAVNGQSYVMFAVNFENIGNSTIYIAAGSGGLSVSTPGNSSVLHAVTAQVCPGTFAIIALDHGQNYTMYGPGCDAGFDYQLVQAGNVTVTFSFDWTTSSQGSTFPDSTTITAQFSFA